MTKRTKWRNFYSICGLALQSIYPSVLLDFLAKNGVFRVLITALWDAILQAQNKLNGLALEVDVEVNLVAVQLDYF